MSAKRLWFLLLLAVPMCAILTQCLSSKKTTDPRGEAFAGTQKCIKCHSNVYNDYIHTAHFTSSRPASMNAIHGSFAPGQNVFSFVGGQMKVAMEKTDSGLYQVAYVNNKKVEAHRFDITFGGKKAETYLYWKGNQVFELPISYFDKIKSWTNSPGYAADHIDFNRPVTRHCFECHSSYIALQQQDSINMADRKVLYDKNTLIYGIDCERCHGPGTNHVNFHTEYPEIKEAKYIRTFKSLTRAQKLDACAVCHSGNKDAFTRTAFAFKIGDTLSKFREPNFLPTNPNPATLDVHGNQNGLLASSKCFLMSNMDCTTCHNPHADQSQNMAIYTQRCLSCHNQVNHNVCKLSASMGSLINNKCIDCHMPARPSGVISVEEQNGKKGVPYEVHTHYITVYPEESKKVLAYLKAMK